MNLNYFYYIYIFLSEKSNIGKFRNMNELGGRPESASN